MYNWFHSFLKIESSNFGPFLLACFQIWVKICKQITIQGWSLNQSLLHSNDVLGHPVSSSPTLFTILMHTNEVFTQDEWKIVVFRTAKKNVHALFCQFHTWPYNIQALKASSYSGVNWDQRFAILWSKMLIFERAFHKLRVLPHFCPPQNFWPLMIAFKWGPYKDFPEMASVWPKVKVLDFKLYLMKSEFFRTFNFDPWQFSCPLRKILV